MEAGLEQKVGSDCSCDGLCALQGHAFFETDNWQYYLDPAEGKLPAWCVAVHKNHDRKMSQLLFDQFSEEMQECDEALDYLKQIIAYEFRAINVTASNDKCPYAHAHWHVIPDYAVDQAGETTKPLPQDEVLERLRKHFF